MSQRKFASHRVASTPRCSIYRTTTGTGTNIYIYIYMVINLTKIREPLGTPAGGVGVGATPGSEPTRRDATRHAGVGVVCVVWRRDSNDPTDLTRRRFVRWFVRWFDDDDDERR